MADPNPLNEWQATQEYWQLLGDPIFRGESVTPGDGRPVIVIPGLFGNDLYLQTIRTWLQRIGYQPLASNIIWNVGCAKRLLGDVQQVLEQIPDAAAPVAVIGHSRGGLLAKALASTYPDRINKMILVGSPLGGMLAAGPDRMQQYMDTLQANTARSMVFNAGRTAMRVMDPDCDMPVCGCEYMQRLHAPLPGSTQVTCIYSIDDPIVPPPVSMLVGGNNIQVGGTHAGLMFNREVYPYVAAALAI
ncbi:MAG: alpha/beta fold hydrolase [Pseudomonadota bacterium]